MQIPVDLFMALMCAGRISIQEQNAHSYNFWKAHADLEFHPDSVQKSIDFSDSTEWQEGSQK